MPTTVSGSIKSLLTSAIGSSSNAFVRFWLRGTRGNQPVVVGSGAIAPLQSQNNIFYCDIAADGSGNVSGTIYSTRDATGLLAGDITLLGVNGSGTAVNYGMQIFNNGVAGPEVPVHAKSGVVFDPASITPITTLPIVTAPTGDNTYLRLDGGNSPVTGTTSFTSNLHYKILNGSWFNAKLYGATGDGATDDSTAIQAAIDAASALKGGTVYFPAGKYKCNLTLKWGVTLAGAVSGFQSYDADPNDAPVQLLDASSGASPVIAVASGAKFWAIKDLYIQGTGSGSADRGIYISNGGYGSFIERVTLATFGEEAIRWEAGGSLHLNHVIAIGSLKNARVSRSGVVYMGGVDGGIWDSEISGSLSALSSASMYKTAIMLAGSNNWVSDSYGEFADIGIYVASTSQSNLIRNSRFELNFGPGVYNEGSGTWIGNKAEGNSQDTTNTYDGFYTTGNNNLYVGNLALTTITTTKYHRYGFNDTQSSDANKNYYFNNKSLNHVTAAFSNSASAGAAFTLGDTPAVTISSGTTPSVEGASFVTLTHGSPTTITNFTNGVNGQHLWIVGTANITLQHNASTLYTANGANEVLEPAKVYHFIKNGAAWYEQGLPKNGVFAGTLGVTGTATFSGSVVNSTANGAAWTRGSISEEVTLSTGGATTDSVANLLPANSIIEAVVARVTVTITTATDWKLGDSAQPARFSNVNSTMTAGTTQVGLNHADPTVASANLGPVQVSAAPVRITTTGTPGAGKIRITVFYRQFTAPTS